jgi:defect in organelle trafficking protein DotC
MLAHIRNSGVYLVLSLLVAASAAAQAPMENMNLEKLLKAPSRPSNIPDGISEARAQTLKQLATGLGTRAGLVDESRRITSEIELEKPALDAKFNFGSLTFSNGALPPVIEEAKDVIAITDYSMKVQGKVYRIVSPASFLQSSWRNYLFLGLTDSDEQAISDEESKVLPKTDIERQYWQSIVRAAHAEGRKQSRRTFAVNLARLERDFNGMRLFYALYSRGLVTAPKFAAATETVSRPDPNTIVVGDSVFRITAQPVFNEHSDQWKATK